MAIFMPSKQSTQSGEKSSYRKVTIITQISFTIRFGSTYSSPEDLPRAQQGKTNRTAEKSGPLPKPVGRCKVTH